MTGNMTYNDALDALRYAVSPIEAQDQVAYLRLSDSDMHASVNFMLIQLDGKGRPEFADCVASGSDYELASWLSYRSYYAESCVQVDKLTRLKEATNWIVADFYEIARRIRSGL